jgi:hypothetical protein
VGLIKSAKSPLSNGRRNDETQMAISSLGEDEDQPGRLTRRASALREMRESRSGQ